MQSSPNRAPAARPDPDFRNLQIAHSQVFENALVLYPVEGHKRHLPGEQKSLRLFLDAPRTAAILQSAGFRGSDDDLTRPAALAGFTVNTFMGSTRDGRPLRIACKTPARGDRPKPTEKPKPVEEKPKKLGLSCDDVSPNFDDDDLPF